MKNFIYIIMLLLMPFCWASAQESPGFEDGELWLSFDLSKELVDNLTLTLKEAIRFDEDVSELKSVFSQATLKYRLIKPLTISAGYRYTTDQRFQSRQRIIVSSQLRHKLDQFSLSWRLRYEQEHELREPVQNRIRNRLKASYGAKKSDFSYFLAFESFYVYNYKYNDIDKVRYIMGIDYEVSKSFEIGITGIIQSEINTARPSDDIILSIGLSYEL